MTFIQTHKEKNISGLVVFVLFGLLLTGVAWLVMLYNQTVNFSHATVQVRQNIQDATLENATLKDRVFSMLEGEEAQKFAADHNLIKDHAPQFVEVAAISPWASVSY